MTGLVITNGYNKSQRLFERNSRPQSYACISRSGEQRDVTLEDRWASSVTIVPPVRASRGDRNLVRVSGQRYKTPPSASSLSRRRNPEMRLSGRAASGRCSRPSLSGRRRRCPTATCTWTTSRPRSSRTCATRRPELHRHAASRLRRATLHPAQARRRSAGQGAGGARQGRALAQGLRLLPAAARRARHA